MEKIHRHEKQKCGKTDTKEEGEMENDREKGRNKIEERPYERGRRKKEGQRRNRNEE